MRSEHLNNKIWKNDVTCVDIEIIINLFFLKQGLFLDEHIHDLCVWAFDRHLCLLHGIEMNDF